MATRWFGQRPLLELQTSGPLSPWPSGAMRHGACGCCKCGGLYTNSDLFTRYGAYRDGLRIKLVIAGLQDAFNYEIEGYKTDVAGMSGWNGTYYLDVVRSQFGCIWSASDFAVACEISYHCYDSIDDLYDQSFTADCGILSESARDSGAPGSDRDVFFYLLKAGITHEITSNAEPDPPFFFDAHPMLALTFEPSSYFRGNGIDGGTFGSPANRDVSKIGWDAKQLPDIISGDVTFRFSGSIAPLNTYDLNDPDWIGIDDFYDQATEEFIPVGTFTAEIERL